MNICRKRAFGLVGKKVDICALDPEDTITIGGVDIADMKREHLRKNIGIVLQEPFLFSKSFKETISDGSVHQDLESVRKYARMAVIDDTIDNFAEGYDTQIGERGVTISGGQKQRVAIARMLMQNTPIKIFDDSLSAVDMETDAKIRRAFRDEIPNTTKLIIAQRISSAALPTMASTSKVTDFSSFFATMVA